MKRFIIFIFLSLLLLDIITKQSVTNFFYFVKTYYGYFSKFFAIISILPAPKNRITLKFLQFCFTK